jgi:quinate dehydrogenase
MSSTTATEQTVLPDTSSVERHGYLFGYPIAHSMSPLFHNTVYADLGLNWGQFYLESKDMEVFLKARQDPKFYGKLPRFPDP